LLPGPPCACSIDAGGGGDSEPLRVILNAVAHVVAEVNLSNKKQKNTTVNAMQEEEKRQLRSHKMTRQNLQN
jgi:hypothetical protein